MDLNEIRSLLGERGGKVVIVENGKPVMVILSYSDYKAVQGEVVNSRDETNEEPPALPEDELTVDDLPL